MAAFEETAGRLRAFMEDAKQFVPDGAHELLYEVHGVRLTESMRKAILTSGFPAWG